MCRSVRYLFLLSLGLAVIAGCGGSGGDGVTLVPAQGTVTYKGAPLAGATVVFVPETGPTAAGMTDTSGVFKVSTGGRSGSVVGKCKVTVTKGDPGASSKQAAQLKPEDMMKMQTGQTAPLENQSLVPAAYGSPNTTPLEATVEPNGDRNKFQFDLVD